MSVERILQNDINDSQRWIDKADGLSKRDLAKRIELINWVLENMKNPDNNICKIIEFKMDEILIKIKKTDSIFELNPLDSELRILNWIFFQVCSNKTKNK